MPRRPILVALIGVLVLGLAGGIVALRLLRPPASGVAATMAPPSPETRTARATGAPAGSLQALVDAAAPGATVVVPPGVYRETVRITKPLTLSGSGAELRGSDVFTTWTTATGGWLSQRAVPELAAGGTCLVPGCDRPEQVFLDGEPLRRVDAKPGSGEFALDASRRVLLGDDPAGHIVEVTVRPAWLTITASDVTVDGLTMNDAASPAQAGGVQLEEADRVTLTHLTLQGAHGADVVIHGGQHIQLTDSELAGAGEEGLEVEDASDVLIQGVAIHGNNTAAFDPAWEAGGLKALGVDGLQLLDDRSYDNDGPGLWCDAGCSNVTYSGNRVYDNSRAGIMAEISSGITITGNDVWENGWDFTTWGWGAGILVSSSSSVTVSGNTVAWNADGISVVSQDRGDATDNDVHGVTVRDNTIVMAHEPGDGSDVMGLAWLQDWNGVLFASGSANGGSGNAYWWSTAAPRCAYDWNGCLSSLSDFNATPGEQGGVLLSSSTKAARLAAAGIPASPAHH